MTGTNFEPDSTSTCPAQVLSVGGLCCASMSRSAEHVVSVGGGMAFVQLMLYEFRLLLCGLWHLSRPGSRASLAVFPDKLMITSLVVPVVVALPVFEICHLLVKGGLRDPGDENFPWCCPIRWAPVKPIMRERRCVWTTRYRLVESTWNMPMSSLAAMVSGFACERCHDKLPVLSAVGSKEAGNIDSASCWHYLCGLAISCNIDK